MDEAHHEWAVQLVGEPSFLCSVQQVQYLSSLYVSSSEATATHNGTKTLSITIKWVCVQGGGGEGVPQRLGVEPVCPECTWGMPRSNMGRLRMGVGGDVLHLGK